MKTGRFWAVVALLLITALLIARHSRSEPVPVRQELSRFPTELSGWRGTDQALDADTLKVLGAGDFLARVYAQDRRVPPISLFIAYFPTQRAGVSIHSPKNCLPGAGWAFVSSQHVRLPDARGRIHQVGEYTIANGPDRQFVAYWYEFHGRSVAGEYAAMFHMIGDAIRTNRSDGALVRVITPILRGEGTARARSRAESFVAELAPVLPQFIPD